MAESIEILQNVMEKKGYSFREFRLQGEKHFTQISDRSGRALLTLATGKPLYPFATSSARLIARDKMTAYDFVRQNGVPVPRSVVVAPNASFEEATELLEACQSVIVKPVKGAGSTGLTLDVTTRDRLARALQDAWQDDTPAVVQQQFYGEEIRFAVVNGVVRAALLRQKPHVVGDGISTVARLIERENEQRRAITDTLVPYPQLTSELIGEEAMTDQTVLSVREIKELNKSTMIRGGASVYDILSTIHPSYIKAAEQAAYGIGRGFIVVDMMVQDQAVSATNDNHVFIEFNLAPALSLFYSCRDGKHVPIVENFLAPMLETAMEGNSDA